MADDLKQTGKRDATGNRANGRGQRGTEPSVLRAATDELGITTPKETHRLRRKGPIRVKVYADPKRQK
jgi:hypothetical protein